MRSFSVLIAGSCLLLLLGCGPNQVKTNSHIDWRAPIFLDSGKIGFFQIAWEEVYTTCGYWGDDVCGEPKRPRAYFVAFSPADSSLDTLFEAAARDYDFSIDVRVEYHPPWLYYHYAGTHAAYNFTTGQHRIFPGLGVFLGEFSRSGRYLVYEQRRVEVATGTVEEILSAPWRIDYYDDIAGKAILYRWSTSDQPGSYMVLHDFSTGAMDGTNATTRAANVRPVSGGEFILWGRRLAGNDTEWMLFARADGLDLGNSVLDSVLVAYALSINDLDLERGVVVTGNESYDVMEGGISVTGFDGNGTTYKARDFHPEYPAAVPLPP